MPVCPPHSGYPADTVVVKLDRISKFVPLDKDSKKGSLEAVGRLSGILDAESGGISSADMKHT